MSEYFESQQFRQDFNNLLKSIVLISKRLEEVSDALATLNNNTEKLVNKTNTDK